MKQDASRRATLVFQDFLRQESAGAVMLLLATAAALVWANSPAAPLYARIWQTPVVIGVGGLGLAKPLVLWVNEGLMALFFFVVGLEIKREVLVGELAAPRRVALPAAAAIGGMVAPAAVYLALNLGGPGNHGWGVPTATDIAFALGVLALLGSRVPPGLKVFLTALAIVDDLGAVLIIALFYTAEINVTMLGIGLGIFALMGLVAAAGVRRVGVYGLLAVALWVVFLKSGVHATVAGLLAALTIPSTARVRPADFRNRSRGLLDEFEVLDPEPAAHRLSAAQQDVVYAMAGLLRDLETPLQRLEHALLPWVTFLVMPIFALANAGVTLGAGIGEAATHPVSLGIVLGLVLGKPIGIGVFAWLATAAGLAELPRDTSWRHVVGAGALAGIGFTMSLFIAGLAFGDTPLLDDAKVGIFLASLLAGLTGVVLLIRAASAHPAR